MKIEVIFDDGRASTQLDTTPTTTQDPFMWDAQRRAKNMAAIPGYPPPRSSNVAARALVRQDLFATEGLRVDFTWYNSACGERTGAEESYRPGVDIFVAAQEVGRTVKLVSPEDMGHVLRIDVDGEPRWCRWYGDLCDAVAYAAAKGSAYACAGPAIRRILRLPDSDGPDPMCPRQVVQVHELMRAANPGWRDPDASEALGRPVWDEERIARAHGMTERAWWRAAAVEAAEGALYDELASWCPALDADQLKLALFYHPAVAWFRHACEDGGPQECRAALGLPEADGDGVDTAYWIRRAWDGRPREDLNRAMAMWYATARRATAGRGAAGQTDEDYEERSTEDGGQQED